MTRQFWTTNAAERVDTPMTGDVIAFGQPATDVRGLSDSDFLQQVLWTMSAPPDIHQAAVDGRVDRFWRAWSKAMTARGDRKLWRKRQANRSLLWPWDDAREHPAKSLLSLLEKKDWPRLSRWVANRLAGGRSGRHEAGCYRECLLLGELLLGGWRVDAQFAWPVWRLVLTWAIELSTPCETPDGCDPSAEKRLMQSGELPWLLGQLFAGVAGVTEFKQLGQQSLRNELIELTDGDGTPSGSLLALLPRWLASLIRAVEIGAILGEPVLEGEAKFRFEDVVTKAVLLLDRDGCFLRGDSNRVKRRSSKRGTDCQFVRQNSTVAMLLRGAELAELDELSLAAESLRHRVAIAKNGRGANKPKTTFAESPEDRLIVTDTDLPAVQSDWAGWACLRSWWHATANTTIVQHDGLNVRLQIAPQGVPMIDGEWGLNVSLAGEPLTWRDRWQCVCWVSDPDMDYLELSLEWPAGPTVCRQVMLSRQDQFLVLADAVSRAGSRRVDLESRLPLCRGARVKPDSQTRELRLNLFDVCARVFPLGLPDDRLLSTVGKLDAQDGSLRLVQSSSSESLYAPLVLDWSPERTKLDAEWRTLTVTELGQKLASWQAAAHRLRVGNLHLVVYHSLTDSDDSRAVLGLQTDQETVIARFDEKGYVLPLVSVDP